MVCIEEQEEILQRETAALQQKLLKEKTQNHEVIQKLQEDLNNKLAELHHKHHAALKLLDLNLNKQVWFCVCCDDILVRMHIYICVYVQLI